jgi:hypothetical protein
MNDFIYTPAKPFHCLVIFNLSEFLQLLASDSTGFPSFARVALKFRLISVKPSQIRSSSSGANSSFEPVWKFR